MYVSKESLNNSSEFPGHILIITIHRIQVTFLYDKTIVTHITPRYTQVYVSEYLMTLTLKQIKSKIKKLKMKCIKFWKK